MESRPDPEQAQRELLETNRALVDEVRVIRRYVDALQKQQERMRRYTWIILLPFLGLVAVFMLGGCLLRPLLFPMAPGAVEAEDPMKRWERQLDRADRQLDRNEKLAERADALVGRWEKAAPKE
jgi:hypothetical protein